MNKSSVYTTKERVLLTLLVREHEVVESKKIDGTTLSQKNRAWELISDAFNSHPEVNGPRTATQLRKLWSNLKHQKRKQNISQNTEETAGGPQKKSMLDSESNFVEDAAWDITVADVKVDTEDTFEDPLAQEESTETDYSVKKVEESIEQQRELHSLRLKILQEERELAKRKAELEMRKLKLDLRKAEDEAELASLKLAEYMCKIANGR